MANPEPWLRGIIDGLHPAAAHLLYTFEQTLEELGAWQDLDPWQHPAPGIAALGFHMRHIAGSVDRLTTYLCGDQLSEAQLSFLRQEQTIGPSFDELMAAIAQQFVRTEAVVRTIEPSSYEHRRFVGRKQLPTTVGGLIVHMSEHTQRHLGQAALTAKLLRS